MLEWLLVCVGATIVALAFFMVGHVIRDKKVARGKKHLDAYLSLTPKSKELVDGYTHARMINDERTTYRERRK